ncbi:MAG: hypothetical protein QNJ60_01850 [Xenococcaceae cyanobacterium MO_188.B19]|nr:hypothetical protein [Xenococcaceae cyanobacterium MO_188.B19]
MSRSRWISEELIKIKADQIGKKRERQGRVKTPDVDLVIAKQYFKKYWWLVFWWKYKKLLFTLTLIAAGAYGIYCVNTSKTLKWADWTGFGENKVSTTIKIEKDNTGKIKRTPINEELRSGKTFWDWLELSSRLAVPILIAVFGYQVQQRQKEAEQILKQDQLRAEIRTDYLKRLGVLYRRVKDARRSLRAAGLTTKFENSPDTLSDAQANAYKKEMQNLNHAQLELEALKIEAESLPAFVSINQLKENLEDMEKYLRKILKEYEKTSPILDSGIRIYWNRLKDLDEFTETAKKKTKRFNTQFSDPYYCAIKLISQNLINY